MLECAIYVSTCRHLSMYVDICRHVSACVDMCRHTLTYVDICRHMSTYVDICRHMSTYVDICRHMSTYVDLCRHMSTLLGPANIGRRFCPHRQDLFHFLRTSAGGSADIGSAFSIFHEPMSAEPPADVRQPTSAGPF